MNYDPNFKDNEPDQGKKYIVTEKREREMAIDHLNDSQRQQFTYCKTNEVRTKKGPNGGQKKVH